MTLEMKILEEREDAAIESAISTMHELHIDNNVIINKIADKYSLTHEEAKAKCKEYFNLIT